MILDGYLNYTACLLSYLLSPYSSFSTSMHTLSISNAYLCTMAITLTTKYCFYILCMLSCLTSFLTSKCSGGSASGGTTRKINGKLVLFFIQLHPMLRAGLECGLGQLHAIFCQRSITSLERSHIYISYRVIQLPADNQHW